MMSLHQTGTKNLKNTTIIDTLRSPIVEENALAQEIEDWITSTTDTW